MALALSVIIQTIMVHTQQQNVNFKLHEYDKLPVNFHVGNNLQN